MTLPRGPYAASCDVKPPRCGGMDPPSGLSAGFILSHGFLVTVDAVARLVTSKFAAQRNKLSNYGKSVSAVV